MRKCNRNFGSAFRETVESESGLRFSVF